MQAVSQGFKLYQVDDLAYEGLHEQRARLALADATLSHVEERLVVELAYGGAVGALHVVGIDFEHGLGEHAGRAGGAQVLIGHLRGCLLGSMLHEHASGKGAGGLFVEHVLIELVARAVGRTVGDKGVVVGVLVLVGNHGAVAGALGSLAREGQVELVAGGSVVQGEHVVAHAAVGLLVDVDVAHAHILVVGFLQTIEVELGILTHEGFDDLGGEERGVVGSMVAEQQLGLGSLFEHDEHAAVHHQRHAGGGRLQDVDHLHGLVDDHSLGHVDEQPVLRQHRVQV